ncbi:MAG: hypothetical protein A2V85_10390 [Chloroflexi bacterium RBG_16_72_14]|nr:MAG: hypothetical protein A2V85_10390 [Chloroflexi bacterium RBG_16_72_14]
MGETKVQLEITARRRDTIRALGKSIQQLREDAAVTRSALARAAGIDPSYEGRIETGEREPSLTTLTALATVLGADLSVRLYPTTGARIRDHLQAAMVETLIRCLHPRWRPVPEIPVMRPARGVIDLVLAERTAPLLVASEVHSELRRLEQQVRWHREKEASLPSSSVWPAAAPTGEPVTLRLLVLRVTRAMLDLARTYEATLRAAYPAAARDVMAALTGASVPWPGPGIVWARVEGGRAELLDGAPRGVRLGR